MYHFINILHIFRYKSFFFNHFPMKNLSLYPPSHFLRPLLFYPLSCRGFSSSVMLYQPHKYWRYLALRLVYHNLWSLVVTRTMLQPHLLSQNFASKYFNSNYQLPRKITKCGDSKITGQCLVSFVFILLRLVLVKYQKNFVWVLEITLTLTLVWSLFQ